MKGFLNTVFGASRLLNVFAGIALTFLMLLTTCDIILRLFKRPIVGTYELVAFSGAVAIGFCVPLTSWKRSHVYVDFLIQRFSKKARDMINISTRILVIILFIAVGWNLVLYAMDLQRSGEVSSTLQVPFYPIAYGLAVSFFILCLVMFCDIVKILGGQYE